MTLLPVNALVRFIQMCQHGFHAGAPVAFKQTAGQPWLSFHKGLKNLSVIADRAAHESGIAHVDAFVPADNLFEAGKAFLKAYIAAGLQQGLVPAQVEFLPAQGMRGAGSHLGVDLAQSLDLGRSRQLRGVERQALQGPDHGVDLQDLFPAQRCDKEAPVGIVFDEPLSGKA